MACRRIETLDLPAFLKEPAASEFDDFRSHYPGCPACSAEIRVWTELHLQLHAEAGGHPSVDELLRLQDDPDSLSTEDRDGLARHLSSCAACAEEVRAMETFAPGLGADASGAEHARPEPDPVPPNLDLERLVAAESAPAARAGVGFSGSAPPASLREALRRDAERELADRPDSGWGRRVARVVWSPAFAYAALLVVTLPLVLLRRDVVVEPIRQSVPAPAVPPETADGVDRAARAPSDPASAVATEAPRKQRLEDEMVVRSMRTLPPQAHSAPDAAPAMPLRELGSVEDAASAEAEGIATGRRRLTAVRRGDDLVVAVPVPRRFAGADRLEVLVTTPAGRELRQPIPERAGASVEVVLPAAWLATPTFELEVRDERGRAETFGVATSPRAE